MTDAGTAGTDAGTAGTDAGTAGTDAGGSPAAGAGGAAGSGGTGLLECRNVALGASQYVFCDTPSVRRDARAVCEDLGMELVRVNDTVEKTFLLDTARLSVVAPIWVLTNSNDGCFALLADGEIDDLGCNRLALVVCER